MSNEDFETFLSQLNIEVPELKKGETLNAEQAKMLVDIVSPIGAKFIELEQRISSVWK